MANHKAAPECFKDAKLGLVDETSEFVLNKMKDSGRRLPAFWGPGADWVPDFNHGDSHMINLQEMLMQTDGQEIYLFPSCPTDWDVKLKCTPPGIPWLRLN